ncbi:MAG TPA: acyl-CoA thioesterase [Rhodobacteraceae bacterium]|jgi:4-hydroxybenzoyl-CoA thioesterase|nr:acyl-CoA thioesterase [Paracoccaceae bacterium]
MFESQREITVEWGDCDPADIVFYPNYFRWFDAATAHHFKAAGCAKPELIARFGVVGFPMVDTRATFHAPTAHGDDLVIHTRIPRIGRSSFEVEHRLMRGEDLAVEGWETRVLVRRAEGGGLTSCPVPETLREMLGHAS